jgi:hypothetical protein
MMQEKRHKVESSGTTPSPNSTNYMRKAIEGKGGQAMNRNPVFLKIQKAECAINASRHVLCPCYDQCLNEAVIKNQNFECDACPFKLRNVREYIVHDGMPD